MSNKILFLVFFLCWSPGFSFQKSTIKDKKIVLLAGAKSHGAGAHEYIKSVRLIKAMLDNSNVKGFVSEVYLNGWPEDPSTLEDADLIVTISDGFDGKNPNAYLPVPWQGPDRLAIIERQMNRGCGFVSIHFSTFMDDKVGQKVLEWGGGYFDWQGDNGLPEWYSSISTINSSIKKESLGNHSITNGVVPFELKDEFYYNIRFRDEDPRLVPILSISELATTQKDGKVVAWAVERENGGRGFCTTMGHYYSNWENENFRKLLLNGIVWAAGIKVPKEGIISRFYDDREVTQILYGKTRKGLILTGNNHPAHNWKETTPKLKALIEENSPIHMDVTTDLNDLYEYDLKDYQLIVFNYCNWEDSTGLAGKSKASLINFLNDGGGLVVVHFSNGAFHHSLPAAGKSDWPEYRKIVPRVWNHGESQHDKYGEFMVEPTGNSHPIIDGIGPFKTIDELYFNQAGDIPIVPLLQAKSNITGKNEPLAWVHQYGKGRIFQILLGHSLESLETPEVQEIIRRGAVWVTEKKR